MVNMKLTFLAVLAVAATFVVADDEPATNGTTGGGNGTILDDGSGGNGTVTNGTATNGTATNGTATNGTASNGTATNATEPAEPSGGSTRRSLKLCEYGCPASDLAAQPLDLFTHDGDGTFTCTFVSGSCDYQSETGVLSSDNHSAKCPGAAVPLVAGCIAGQSNNGGVEKRRRHNGRRSSRQIQYESLVKRLGL